MTQLTLKEALKGIPPERVVWRQGGQSKSAGDISCWLENVGLAGGLRGRSVALSIDDQMRLAHILVLLDGLASDILLLPPELDWPDMEGYFRLVGIEIVLTDNAEIEVGAERLGCAALDLDALFDVSQEGDAVADGTSDQNASEIGTKWIIPTSGTTGRPKLITHDIGTLSRSTKSNVEKGGRFCWGLLYGLTRFAGLQVFLQSFLSGSKLIFASSTMAPRDLVEQLADCECNALSATPTMYRRLLLGADLSLLSLTQITLGGEIVDQQIIDALKRVFPKARIIHIYASTEAGVGFVVSDILAGFPESYLDAPVAGVDIRVSADNYLLLRNNKMRQEELGNSMGLRDTNGFINTGDLVTYEAGRYYFSGRANGAINVGGMKVQPEEIESVIREVPGVRLVLVSSKKSSITGQLVTASVVVDGEHVDQVQLSDDIRQHCGQRLADYKVPAIIRIVDDLAVNHSGKIKRN